MSGSPKYSQVVRTAQRRAAEEAARRAAAERRARIQAERLARAQAVKTKSAQLRAQRQTDRTQRLARERAERIAAQERSAALVAQRAATLNARRAQGEGSSERARQIARARTDTAASLRQRLDAVVDETGALGTDRENCAKLLAELQDALHAPDDGVRFDTLSGGVEQAVKRFERAAAEATRRRRAELEAAQEERARLDAERERLDTIVAAAQTAAADAPEADLPELADELHAALDAARQAVEGGPAAAAAEAVGKLEKLTSDAETRLDEAVILAERRAELADALKQAMVRRGMFYDGGDRVAGRMVLRFSRANGATYTAQITDHAESGESMLTYTVAGESDVLVANAGEAVCDQTEDLIAAVHEGLAEHGFEAGETVWVGKPRGRRRPPSGAASRRPGQSSAPAADRTRGGAS